MLKVDLGQLDREGSVAVETRVSAGDALWADSQIPWAGDIYFRLQATHAGTGEIVARGTATGTLNQECRRCLQPVETPFVGNLTIVFVAEEATKDEGEGDSGGYAFKGTDAVLDMSDAVREEVVLAMNSYAVCRADCRGFCSTCGADLNAGDCGCREEGTDPRWAALQNLKDD